MTEVMSFFQAMFMFKNFVPAIAASEQEVKLAVDLKAEAQRFLEVAEEEVKNGKTAQALAAEATDENKIRAFSEIAVWHNTRAADKYRKAAERFAEAGKVYIKKSKAFHSKAQELTRRAAEAEAEVNSLNDSLKQTK